MLILPFAVVLVLVPPHFVLVDELEVLLAAAAAQVALFERVAAFSLLQRRL